MKYFRFILIVMRMRFNIKKICDYNRTDIHDIGFYACITIMVSTALLIISSVVDNYITSIIGGIMLTLGVYLNILYIKMYAEEQ